ncbi:MAG: hypothetical protein WC586_07945 [Methanoregula sp.]
MHVHEIVPDEEVQAHGHGVAFHGSCLHGRAAAGNVVWDLTTIP